MTTARHAEKTIFQAINAPCDSCNKSEFCEMKIACRDFALWVDDGKWRYESRVPNRSMYNHIFREHDHHNALV